MGQRHQIYVALPAAGSGYGSNRSERVIGIHHQWLYGHTAVHMAKRFLTFVDRARETDGRWHPIVSGFQSPMNILRAIYSSDPDIGYYHDVHDLEGELGDPRLGDNNDGITVFDLRALPEKRGPISYCFVSFGHKGLPELVPISARSYCRAYYPAEVPETRVRGRIAPTLDGRPNVAETRVRAFEKLKVPLMTPRALHELWPDTFPVVARDLRPRLVLPELGDHE